MRTAGVACVLMVAFSQASLGAQQADQRLSVEFVRQVGQLPAPPSLVVPRDLASVPPANRRLGILTLAVPDAEHGEVVKVIVPIGEVTARLTRRISSAHRQRRERKAREAVERDLRDFLAQQAAK